jgi:hypothetical protein
MDPVPTNQIDKLKQELQLAKEVIDGFERRECRLRKNLRDWLKVNVCFCCNDNGSDILVDG